MSDRILVEEHAMIIPLKFACNWLSSFRQEDFQVNFLKGSMLNLSVAAILVGG